MQKSITATVKTLALATAAPVVVNLASATTIFDHAPLTPLAGVNTAAILALDDAYTVAQSGNDNVLVVVYGGRGDGGVPTDATFGGVTMTPAKAFTQVESSLSATTAIYYLPQEDFEAGFTTTAQDLTITRPGGDDGYVVGLFTLSGVDQTDPIGVTDGIGSTADGGRLDLALSGLKTDGSLVVTVSSSNYQGSNNIFDNVGTKLFENISGHNNRASAGITFPDEASETISYDYAIVSGGRGALIGVEFNNIIPEPSTFGLLALAGLGMVHRRRRSSACPASQARVQATA